LYSIISVISFNPTWSALLLSRAEFWCSVCVFSILLLDDDNAGLVLNAYEFCIEDCVCELNFSRWLGELSKVNDFDRSMLLNDGFIFASGGIEDIVE
jgi:hypothetical protein